VIKLVDLLLELSPAGQQAKKLGYTSAGFGNWRKEKGGPVIAKTKDGKLVPVKGAEKGGAKKKPVAAKGPVKKKAKPDARPRARGAKDVAPKKKAPAEQPSGLNAIQQLHKKSTRSLIKAMAANSEDFTSSDFKRVVQDVSTSAVMNPSKSTKQIISDNVFYYILQEMTPEARQLVVDYVDGIKAVAKQSPLTPIQKIEAYASFGDKASKQATKRIKALAANGVKIDNVIENRTSDFHDTAVHKKFAKSQNLKSLPSPTNLRKSKKQGDGWRGQMTPKEIISLGSIQYDWQEDAIYSNRAKKRIFKDINKLTRKYGVPDAGVSTVYRGMGIPHGSAATFLSNFRVGESVVSPPSGYSTDFQTAVDFGYNKDEGHRVILNLKGDGDRNVGGIHFSSKHKPDGEGGISSDESHFVTEQEVVVPSTHGQRVSGMETTIAVTLDEDDEPYYEFITHVSLIQDSKPGKKTMFEAKKPSMSQDEKTARSLYAKYMGGSVRGLSDRSQMLLKRFMGGRVNPNRRTEK